MVAVQSPPLAYFGEALGANDRIYNWHPPAVTSQPTAQASVTHVFPTPTARSQFAFDHILVLRLNPIQGPQFRPYLWRTLWWTNQQMGTVPKRGSTAPLKFGLTRQSTYDQGKPRVLIYSAQRIVVRLRVVLIAVTRMRRSVSVPACCVDYSRRHSEQYT